MAAADVPAGIPLDPSLPRASYVEEAEFRRERDALLFSGWFCVGRAESLPAEGDYLTADVAGESILIVRTADGLAGFYNLCRDRGSRLVPPGRAAAADQPRPQRMLRRQHPLPVPRLDLRAGRIAAGRAVPARPARVPRQLALHPVDTAMGRVCVRPAEPGRRAGAEPLGALGAFRAGWLPTRWPAAPGSQAGLPGGGQLESILENYNECYHCGPVHPELCELVPAFAAAAAARWTGSDGVPHRDGPTTFTRTGTTRRKPFPGLSAAERDRHKGELVLPNLMLACPPTTWPRSRCGRMRPGGTTVSATSCSTPMSSPRRASTRPTPWRLGPGEPAGLDGLRAVQDGMTSRRFTTGYLAPMEQPSADVVRYVPAACPLTLLTPWNPQYQGGPPPGPPGQTPRRRKHHERTQTPGPKRLPAADRRGPAAGAAAAGRPDRC